MTLTMEEFAYSFRLLVAVLLIKWCLQALCLIARSIASQVTKESI